MGFNWVSGVGHKSGELNDSSPVPCDHSPSTRKLPSFLVNCFVKGTRTRIAEGMHLWVKIKTCERRYAGEAHTILSLVITWEMAVGGAKPHCIWKEMLQKNGKSKLKQTTLPLRIPTLHLSWRQESKWDFHSFDRGHMKLPCTESEQWSIKVSKVC